MILVDMFQNRAEVSLDIVVTSVLYLQFRFRARLITKEKQVKKPSFLVYTSNRWTARNNDS